MIRQPSATGLQPLARRRGLLHRFGQGARRIAPGGVGRVGRPHEGRSHPAPPRSYLPPPAQWRGRSPPLVRPAPAAFERASGVAGAGVGAVDVRPGLGFGDRPRRSGARLRHLLEMHIGRLRQMPQLPQLRGRGCACRLGQTHSNGVARVSWSSSPPCKAHPRPLAQRTNHRSHTARHSSHEGCNSQITRRS